jgi:hypothetical protein
MKVIFKKSQLKLHEDNMSQKLPPKTVMNSEGDSDTSSLQNDLSQVNQANADGSDVVIPTNQFTNKVIPAKNKGMVTTLPNNSDAGALAAKMINTTNANEMPSMIRLQNSVERSGKLVEVATFKKNELDKFLKSL